MRRRGLPVFVVVFVGLVLLQARALNADSTAETEILVRVNDSSVTQADLELAYLVRGISSKHREALRRPLLERLVDERLIAAFLDQRRINPRAIELDVQMEQLLALIRRRGEEPDELLARLGLDRQKLRTQLSLPLAWETYAREVLTPHRFRAYFDKHRRELDGTQVRARHIVLKVPADASDAQWERVMQRLEAIRQQIQDGRLTFQEAARQYSEGPSAAKGGDVGFFAYRGTMPAAFSDAAFALKLGQISDPVKTHAGLHLIEFTDERPGQLSLEDVREPVFECLSSELWEQHVSRERAQARIRWVRPEDAPKSP